MKTLIALFIGFSLAYFAMSNKPLLKDLAQSLNEPNTRKSTDHNNRYGNYDPGTDNNFSIEERNYFNEIAKKTEYGGNTEISRWIKDMKIYVAGEKPDYLMTELYNIVQELNDLIDPIEIEIVNNKKESNYTIFFGSQHDYNSIEPTSSKYTQNNWGLFVINGGETINRGSMYVDIYRCYDVEGQKHLLREELTQSLGLTNDSYMYPESIFYQQWSTTTSFAPIDKKMIQMLYNYW
ncbi:MAG: DUF2927 domain-containing protein [Crocinitomicaceae bacterium]